MTQLTNRKFPIPLSLVSKKVVNNIVALWRLGARNILELPLLPASSKMETAPTAGKTWQPSHEPPRPRKEQAPVTLIHSGKQRVGREGTKKKPLNAPHTMLLLPATLINKRYSPKHKVFHACASILKPLTNWLQSLLVVYLVKLRLTSFNAMVLWHISIKDFDQLSAFVKKHFSMDLEEVELSVKGWNWGVAKFKGKSRKSILKHLTDKSYTLRWISSPMWSRVLLFTWKLNCFLFIYHCCTVGQSLKDEHFILKLKKRERKK